LLESVRCLDCGDVYAKPVEGGTALENPGCPNCGYVGWRAVNLPPQSAPRRFVGDPLPHLRGQSG
jgi:hypothetical protein